MFVSLLLAFFLSLGLHKYCHADFHETWWEGWTLMKCHSGRFEAAFKFCLNFPRFCAPYSQVRKSTLNPNANEFKPRLNTQVSMPSLLTAQREDHKLRLLTARLKLWFFLSYVLFDQPKPANTPTPPRPQGQPSPSIVVQQPQTVYGQTVCFPQMYPLTPVSPGVQVRASCLCWKLGHPEHDTESVWNAPWDLPTSLSSVLLDA